MLKTVTAHGQTLRVFGKLMAGISLAVCLTGCGKTNKANQPADQMKTVTWSEKKVSNTKTKEISDWVNKAGNRTKVNVYSSIPDVAGVVATANMKSGYVNRVYKYKSPAILDNYYFSYVSAGSVKNKSIKHVSFKSAQIDGVQISKDSGNFNNAVVYVSKDMIAKENKLAKKALKKKSKAKDVNAYSEYRDGLYGKLIKALGLAASNGSYKMAVVK
jgi:transcription antitermination factor NusA-like protein